MNPKSYRNLANPVSTRVRCPVCHEAVYSRAGIHPQCAVRQSDPPKPSAKEKAKAALLLAEAEQAAGLVVTDPNAGPPVVDSLPPGEPLPV